MDKSDADGSWEITDAETGELLAQGVGQELFDGEWQDSWMHIDAIGGEAERAAREPEGNFGLPSGLAKVLTDCVVDRPDELCSSFSRSRRGEQPPENGAIIAAAAVPERCPVRRVPGGHGPSGVDLDVLDLGNDCVARQPGTGTIQRTSLTGHLGLAPPAVTHRGGLSSRIGFLLGDPGRGPLTGHAVYTISDRGGLGMSGDDASRREVDC